jgi:hypothetical protein
MGHTPLDLANLEPGAHRLEIQYDDGDSSSSHAAVYVGAISQIALPGAKLREVGRLREGVKPVFGAGLFVGAALGEQYFLGGAGLAGGLNFGLAQRVDLRWLGHLQLASVSGHPWFEAGTSASIRLNLSSAYSMELGVRIALMPEPDVHYVSTVRSTFGLQGSLLSLRFGEERSQELSLWHAVQLSFASHRPAFQSGVSFMHVWQ